MPEIEKEKEIEIEKKNVKSIAGHIIDEKTDEKEKREPESVLDVDEHMSEKQKLSLMNKQQKREYILEYYAPKALFALVVVGIVVFLVVKHFTAEAAALNILAVNTTQQGSAANDKEYYEEFLGENGLDAEKEYVSISTGIGVSTDPNDAMSQDSLQLIQNKFMANAVDVFFADTDLVMSFGEFGLHAKGSKKANSMLENHTYISKPWTIAQVFSGLEDSFRFPDGLYTFRQYTSAFQAPPA